VVKELKASGYRPSIAVLASKTQYCNNAKVKGADVSVDEGCEALMESEGGCPHHANVNRLVRSVNESRDLKARVPPPHISRAAHALAPPPRACASARRAARRSSV